MAYRISSIVQHCYCEQSWSAGLSPEDKLFSKYIVTHHSPPPPYRRQEGETERMQLWRHDNKAWGLVGNTTNPKPLSEVSIGGNSSCWWRGNSFKTCITGHKEIMMATLDSNQQWEEGIMWKQSTETSKGCQVMVEGYCSYSLVNIYTPPTYSHSHYPYSLHMTPDYNIF